MKHFFTMQIIYLIVKKRNNTSIRPLSRLIVKIKRTSYEKEKCEQNQANLNLCHQLFGRPLHPEKQPVTETNCLKSNHR